jgi:hypothetical protein
MFSYIKMENIIGTLIGIVVVLAVLYHMKNGTKEGAMNVIQSWVDAVTVQKDPEQVADMFCPDGTLVGTVSSQIRSGPQIKEYFEYFAKLPGLKVLKMNPTKVQNVRMGVWLVTSFVTWEWEGLPEPIVARMSFLLRDGMIFQLHSSALPERPSELAQEAQPLYAFEYYHHK